MTSNNTPSTNGRLAGKVVLVSGAASGMGAQHARSICQEGGSVAIGDISHQAGRQLAQELNDTHGSTVSIYVELDVTNFDEWTRAVEATEGQFGALHGLVNNAGVGSTGSVETADIDAWKRTVDINLNGNFYGMKAAVPLLKKNSTSSIVNVSSIAGLTGFKNRAAYSASKWGVQGLTKTSALDLGDMGIRVNSIHPGSVNTPLTAGLKRGFGQVPAGRAAEVDEISPLVTFLLSDESRYISGANIAIDGGETAGNNLRAFN